MRAAMGLVALGIALTASVAEAAPAPQRNAYQVVVAVSHDLGVSPQQFVTCFQGARDAILAAQPGTQRVQARNAALLPCLQKANPAITADALGATFDRHRPSAPAEPL